MKLDFSAVSAIADAHEACAMMDGEWKYGFRNWRAKKVRARVYIAAALRHLLAYSDMEDYADDSGVHHLGHGRACMGILLDAMETGNLIDDRAKGVLPAVLDRLGKWVVKRRAFYEEKNATHTPGKRPHHKRTS